MQAPISGARSQPGSRDTYRQTPCLGIRSEVISELSSLGRYLSDYLAVQSACSIRILETTHRNNPQITRQQSTGLN